MKRQSSELAGDNEVLGDEAAVEAAVEIDLRLEVGTGKPDGGTLKKLEGVLVERKELQRDVRGCGQKKRSPKEAGRVGEG